MGDWRRVMIEGTCGSDDVPALREALILDDDYENFHCLVDSKGMCGLPNWAAEKIHAVGNLAERNYDVDDIAETLGELIVKAPSLSVKIHMGSAFESDQCEATISAKVGLPIVGKPEIEKIPALDKGQMQNNVLRQMMGR